LASDLVQFDLALGLAAGWTVNLKYGALNHLAWCPVRVGRGCFLLEGLHLVSQVDQRDECLLVIQLLSRVGRIVRLDWLDWRVSQLRASCLRE
jgi:hypothetical protein